MRAMAMMLVMVGLCGCGTLIPAVYDMAVFESDYHREDPVEMTDPETGETVTRVVVTEHLIKARGGAGDIQQIVGGTREDWKADGSGSFETNIQGDQDLSGRVEAVRITNDAITSGVDNVTGLIEKAMSADMMHQAKGGEGTPVMDSVLRYLDAQSGTAGRSELDEIRDLVEEFVTRPD